MTEDTPTLLCQAEGCTETPCYVCTAWIMTPPSIRVVGDEVFLCESHADRFEAGNELSVVMDPTNLDLVSVARTREISESGG